MKYPQFETLIKNKAIIQAQERWFKDPSEANINIKNINMHISSLNLKRKQILVNERLSYTKPLKLENGIIKI